MHCHLCCKMWWNGKMTKPKEQPWQYALFKRRVHSQEISQVLDVENHNLQHLFARTVHKGCIVFFIMVVYSPTDCSAIPQKPNFYWALNKPQKTEPGNSRFIVLCHWDVTSTTALSFTFYCGLRNNDAFQMTGVRLLDFTGNIT